MAGNGHDPRAIAEAIRLIVGPGQVTELRALEAVTKSDRRPHVASGYFDDADKLVEAVGRLNDAKGIYFVLNSVDPALLARASNRIRRAPRGESTQDSNIVRRRWLLIDADAKRPSGISATDAEHEAALDRARAIYRHLRDAGWPEPIAADSGNGAHLLYRIDLPADDRGLVQRCLQALAQRFDDGVVEIDRSVFNAARICKLYGTTARKGDDTPARPHRMAKILSRPRTLEPVSVSKLEALVAEAGANGRPTRPTALTGNRRPFDVEAFIARHNLDASGPVPWDGQQGRGRRWVLNTDPMDGVHNDGSCFIIEHASGAVSAGCHHNSANWNWHDLRLKYEPEARVVPSKAAPAQPKRASPTVEPFRPFPVDALPEPVRGFVNVGGKAIGCDPSYIALPLLSALASAIGNTRRIELKRGWTEPAIVWTAIVGESGTTKSPALELALRPVRQRQHDAMRECQEAIKQYETVKLQYDRELYEWKRDKTADAPPQKPQEPIAYRCLTDDVTTEALAGLLQTQWRGLLVASDELAGWIGGFDRYAQGKGGDAAKWLSMYNGGCLVVDRKTTGTLYAPQTAVSVTGSIQPETLRRALGQMHFQNGLAARLLLGCPPRRSKRWTEADITPQAKAALGAIFERLYALKPALDENGEPKPAIVTLTPDGKVAWIDFYNAHADEQADLTGDLSAAWSKLEGYAARLALVVHFVRWAAGDPTLGSADAADEQSITAGVELCRWFGQEARRVYTMLGESEGERKRRQLVELVRRKGGSVTTRDLTRSSRLFQPASVAEEALEGLVKAGLGRWQDVPTTEKGGQPTRRFVLADTVDVDTTPVKPNEKAGSVNVNTVNGPAGASPDPDALVVFEERAAIMEFHGNLSRERAEALASAQTS